MEGDTPTFCQESTTNIISSCFSFSEAYNNSIQSKPQTRHSSFHKSHKKHKSEKRKSKFKSNFKKEESFLDAKPKYISDKINTNKYNILKIEEFFNKKKFKLSDKFDRKNAEKFLTSKNVALMKPFLECEEMDEKRHS
jgi:hypothetical protein